MRHDGYTELCHAQFSYAQVQPLKAYSETLAAKALKSCAKAIACDDAEIARKHVPFEMQALIYRHMGREEEAAVAEKNATTMKIVHEVRKKMGLPDPSKR